MARTALLCSVCIGTAESKPVKEFKLPGFPLWGCGIGKKQPSLSLATSNVRKCTKELYALFWFKKLVFFFAISAQVQMSRMNKKKEARARRV